MLRMVKADLHVHTCLSPCAELDMSPTAIAEQARVKKIDLLGICDHNSAENVTSVIKAARRLKICVLPGLEVTSQEEVHVLALFDDQEAAFRVQKQIYRNLPGKNNEQAFGLQAVVNENGEVLGLNEKLLISASRLSIEEVIKLIHRNKGIAIASHIDREGFSLISQLGFIPEGLELDALEISPATSFKEAENKFRPRLPLVSFSDAHNLHEIGRSSTILYIEKGTINEIKKALLNQEKRKVIH